MLGQVPHEGNTDALKVTLHTDLIYEALPKGAFHDALFLILPASAHHTSRDIQWCLVMLVLEQAVLLDLFQLHLELTEVELVV